jgi:hypothetical protein
VGYKGDTCLRYMGIIYVKVDEKYHKDTIIQATVEKAEKYIKDFNQQNTDIIVSYDGPYLYSTNSIIRLWNTKRIMNAKESKKFEHVVYETLNSLEHNESSPNITKILIYKQVLITSDRRQLEDITSNDVYVKVDGSCRACSMDQFDLFTNDAIGDSYSDIEKKLQEKESNDEEGNYFEDVFVIPLGNNTSNTDHPDKNSKMVRESNAKEFKLHIVFGLLSGVVILLIGIGYTLRKRLKAHVKSTPDLEQDNTIILVS